MKKSCKKLTLRRVVNMSTGLLLVFVMLFNFSSCGSEPDEHPLPGTVTALEEKLAAENKEPGSTKANLYYDNTMSMYGYLNAGEQSNYVVLCDDVIDIVKGYNSFSLNALVPDANKILHWSEVGSAAFNAFRKKDFYTFSGTSHFGSFDRANGEFGPLQILFSEASAVNFDELNIFVTDLAEQELNNKDLAEAINDIVLEKDGYSVALYCIESNFKGFASVPVPSVVDDGEVEMFSYDNYDGERPFYLLVVGPTIEVVSLSNEIDSKLEEADMEEGDDYYYLSVLSKRGLQYSSLSTAEAEAFDNLYALDDSSEYDEYADIVTWENSNLNFNMELSSYDLMFPDSDHALPGLYYNYNTERGSLDNSTTGLGVVRFAIPLSQLANGEEAANTTYTVDKDSIKLYGLTTVEEEVTDEYGDVVETTENQVWEEIDAHKLLETSAPYMDVPTVEVLQKGAKIERVTDYATNQDLKDMEYPKDKLTLYTVENESGELIVTVKFNELAALSETYSTISLDFDIVASRTVTDESMPDWVKAMNIPDTRVPNFEAPEETLEFYEKTFGLSDFYNYLVGRMSSASERKNYEAQMTRVVTDAVITVSLDQY